MAPALIRPSETRVAQLAALAAWQDDWVTRKLPTVEFDLSRSREGSDYNQHYVDLDGDDDAFHRKARAILGLPRPQREPNPRTAYGPGLPRDAASKRYDPSQPRDGRGQWSNDVGFEAIEEVYGSVVHEANFGPDVNLLVHYDDASISLAFGGYDDMEVAGSFDADEARELSERIVEMVSLAEDHLNDLEDGAELQELLDGLVWWSGGDFHDDDETADGRPLVGITTGGEIRLEFIARVDRSSFELTLEEATELADALDRTADVAEARDWDDEDEDDTVVKRKVGKRFDPDQPRNADGEWSKVPGSATRGVDALNLAGRIPLEPGERLTGSAVLDSDHSLLPMAWVDTPTGPTLRIGTGISHDDKRRWRGSNRGQTVILNQEGISSLAAAATEMLRAGAEGAARKEDIVARQTELERRQRGLIRRQYPHLTKPMAKELDRLDEQIEDLTDRIGRLEAEDVSNFEELRPQTQDAWRRIEADMRLLIADRDAIRADYAAGGSQDPVLRDRIRTIDHKIEDLLGQQFNLHEEREAERDRMGYAGFARRRRAKLTTLRRDLDNATGRRAELAQNAAPLSATDAAELAAVGAELQQSTDEYWAFVDGSDLASGVIAGAWGDLAYQAVMTDTDVRYRLAVRSPDAPADWYPGYDDTESEFTPAELRRLAEMVDGGPPAVGKADDGTSGRHQARGLIRWFNAGAGGKITWGGPGDLTACHAIASRHMPSQQAWGFCNERHRDVLGVYNDPND